MTMKRLGYDVATNDTGDVEITFSLPNGYQHTKEKNFKVGYTAWESGDFYVSWLDPLKNVDELWVPNQYTKSVFQPWVEKEIQVFPHGVDPVWSPKQRERGKKVRYLHIGYPAVRKNLQLAVEGFLEVFGPDSKDAELIIKCYGEHTPPNIPKDDSIKIISETMTTDNLVKLFHSCDVLLYPSMGEGFGMLPLQALATGMPAIVTEGWADYLWLAPKLGVKSLYGEHGEGRRHPGDMFVPDREDFVNKIKQSYEEIDNLQSEYLEISKDIHKHYSWDFVVSEFFKSFENRYI